LSKDVKPEEALNLKWETERLPLSKELLNEHTEYMIRREKITSFRWIVLSLIALVVVFFIGEAVLSALEIEASMPITLAILGVIGCTLSGGAIGYHFGSKREFRK